MTRIGRIIVLKLTIDVVQAVVLVSILVLHHTFIAFSRGVGLVVSHIDATMGPVLIVIKRRSVRKISIGPPGRHFLLIVYEKLPCRF